MRTSEPTTNDVENEMEQAAREMASSRLEFVGDRLHAAKDNDDLDELREEVRLCRMDLELIESMLRARSRTDR